MPVIVITGAGSGIGAACARSFLAAGWEVAAIGRRQSTLAHVAGVVPIAADLATVNGVAAAAAAVAAWRPAVHALVHAAGDFLVASIERTPPEEFERIWRVAVWAKHALTRALLPQLAVASGQEPAPPARAVVHIASLAAHRDFPEETAYISAMHAVIGLARAQDVELRGRGIRAAVVSPGLVRTPLTERSFPPEVLAGALDPATVAASVVYLVATIRAGGFIPEIFHVPQNSA